MKDRYGFIEEYDGYETPETLKKETPETKAKRKAALKKLDMIINNRHKEIEPALG